MMSRACRDPITISYHSIKLRKHIDKQNSFVIKIGILSFLNLDVIKYIHILPPFRNNSSSYFTALERTSSVLIFGNSLLNNSK